ncbi:MAG: FAD binding domain-containing protein, partial [Acidobacteria bacterium]|nr:FAD binding domain-containing protein [Acidobacteriota bacterium]
MMRLPSYEYLAPRTIEDAAARLAEAPTDTMVLAGGTDLIPNMKRRQQTPARVVGLRRVAGLDGVRVADGCTIGAATTLSSLVHHADVRAQYAG